MCESTKSAIMASRDWELCFICQSNKNSTITMNPSSSVKLKNYSEKLFECHREVADNINILNELGELPDFVANIGGGSSGGGDVVQHMMTNNVVWHKSCRTAVVLSSIPRRPSICPMAKWSASIMMVLPQKRSPTKRCRKN